VRLGIWPPILSGSGTRGIRRVVGEVLEERPGGDGGALEHFKTSPPTKIGFGTLVYLARKHSPGWCYPAEAGVEPVDLWGKFDPPTLPRGLLPKVIEDFAFDQGRTMGADEAGLLPARSWPAQRRSRTRSSYR
jgi:hypothetical protein